MEEYDHSTGLQSLDYSGSNFVNQTNLENQTISEHLEHAPNLEENQLQQSISDIQMEEKEYTEEVEQQLQQQQQQQPEEQALADSDINTNACEADAPMETEKLEESAINEDMESVPVENATKENDNQVTENDNNEENNTEATIEENNEIEEEPQPPKEPKLDPDQCRACNSKENLISIFTIRGELTLARYIMEFCQGLRISERDTLPHFLCSECAETVWVAYTFKIKCEQADKEFRSKLKRSQNKRRVATTDYVLLDASKHLPSSSEEDAVVGQDDDEFQVSQSDDVPDSDDDEDFTPKKKKSSKKPKPKKIKAPAKPKKSAKSKKKEKKSEVKPKKSQRTGKPVQKNESFTKNVVYIEAVISSSDEEVLSKRRRVQKNSYGNEVKKPVSVNQKSSVKTSTPGRLVNKKAAPTRSHTQHQQTRKRDTHGHEPPTGRDLFRSCAPTTSTYWSDSFSD